MHRTRIRLFLTVLMLLVVTAQTYTFAQITHLEGTFTYVPDKSDAVDHAIEAAVSRFNLFVRPFVRWRLRAANAPYQRITIALTPTQVSITIDEDDPERMPLDGTPIEGKDENGEVVQVRTRVEGNALTQEFSTKDGQRLNIYEVSPDGQTLTLQVTVSSQRLAEPVKYRLVYRRV